MADESTDKKPSYLPIAGALFFGIVVGTAMSGGDEAAFRVKKELEERVATAEAQLAEARDAAASAVDSAAEKAAQAAETAKAEATEQIAALEERLASAADSADAEELEALRNRVQVMAEQMAAMITQMREGGVAMAPPEQAPAEAPSDDAAAGDGAAEALTAEIGEDGLVLAVGQTGSVGDTRVFMSRIDSEAGAARVMVVGEGPTMIGGDMAQVELANGCTLSLAGIADNRAYLATACGE